LAQNEGHAATIMSFDTLPREVFLLILKTASGAPHLRLICWRWRECWLEAGEGQTDAWVADWQVTVASIPLAQLYMDLMPCKAWLCPAAAAAGRLGMLQWARAQGCPWSSATCAYAAAEGHLEILDWAIANKCPLDLTVGRAAARRGRLEVLQWMHARTCRLDFERCGQLAAKSGFFGVARWAASLGLNPNVYRAVAVGAARSGYLGILQWVAEYCGVWHDSLVCIKAAKGGHLEVLQWAIANGCPVNLTICRVAARAGQAETFRWIFTYLHSRATFWGVEVTPAWDGFKPAQGRLAILQWIASQVPSEFYKKDVLFDICMAAALDGDVEALRWAAAHAVFHPEIYDFEQIILRGGLAGLQTSFALFGLADSLSRCGILALARGRPETVRWLAGQCEVGECDYILEFSRRWAGWPGTLTLGNGTARRQQLLGMLEWWARRSNRAWSGALFCAHLAVENDLELLQWARAQGFQWDERVCESASRYNYQDILEWAHANGCPCKHSRNA
jgi:hypothetical protein